MRLTIFYKFDAKGCLYLKPLTLSSDGQKAYFLKDFESENDLIQYDQYIYSIYAPIENRRSIYLC